MKRTTRTITTVVAILGVGLPLAGCGRSAEAANVLDKSAQDKLVIGVKYDQPGLAFKTSDGKLSGFTIDVARYIAKQLGVPESGIQWKEAVSANRETFLDQRQVDLVVETYSITDKRKQKVDFAGPFFVAHQKMLVRADDTSISDAASLNGKKLCSIAGSTPAQRIKDKYAKNVQLQEFSHDVDCVEALLGGTVDAMTTDDVILAGYANQHKGKLKVVGDDSISDELYGVGIKKGDAAAVKKIDSILTTMVSSGEWKKAFEANFPASVYPAPEPPTVGEH